MARSVRGIGDRGMWFGVVAVDDDQAQVEHSAASFARLRAFRTGHYNFRGSLNSESLTTAEKRQRVGQLFVFPNLVLPGLVSSDP
jgi:hypothetical protein